MARYLPIIVVALLMIYCVVEVAQAPRFAVRRMPRWLWAVAIICVPLVGSVAWLLLGRPTAESRGERRPRPRTGSRTKKRPGSSRVRAEFRMNSHSSTGQWVPVRAADL